MVGAAYNLFRISKQVEEVFGWFKWAGAIASSRQERSEAATNDLHEERGLRVGPKKYAFAEDYQILSWGKDDFENIRKEFNEFLAASP